MAQKSQETCFRQRLYADLVRFFVSGSPELDNTSKTGGSTEPSPSYATKMTFTRGFLAILKRFLA